MRRLWPWLLVAVVTTVVIFWRLFPIRSDTAVAEAATPAWQLPAVRRPQPELALESLARTSPWGRVRQSADLPPLNPPDWHILAILGRGAERSVVIKVGNQPEHRLRVGDALPGGSAILEIRENSLCVLVNGAKRLLPIYSEGSAL